MLGLFEAREEMEKGLELGGEVWQELWPQEA
jgi:hypothetical protein